jgi:predicted transcriptional regulator of viral defense system
MTELPATYRRRLHERALEQYGYITARDAVEMGIPRAGFNMVAWRGGLTHIGYGVYRFDDVPTTGRDGYMEAVLLVGDGAFLVADAVLALHDLAQVNPGRLRVGTEKRARKTLPPTVEVVWPVNIPEADLTVYEGIPCTTVARALTDCVGIVMRDRLIDAANDAADRGLLHRSERADVLAKLGAQA